MIKNSFKTPSDHKVQAKSLEKGYQTHTKGRTFSMNANNLNLNNNLTSNRRHTQTENKVA